MGAKILIYPLFLPMQGCPGRCVYCDQRSSSGAGDFDIERAVKEVRDFAARNPGRDKQVAFYGGSFTGLGLSFREQLLTRIRDVCDDRTSLRASTHPLLVEPETLDWCRDWGIRTLELGIQDFTDEVLSRSGRGYNGAEARAAVERVRDMGFELGVHLMPGLPGWTESSLQENHRALERLRPAFLRLFPCVVLRGTPLEALWRRGEYLPLTLPQAVEQCAEYYPLSERCQIRIIKLGLPSNLRLEDVAAGPWHPRFGELVRQKLQSREKRAPDAARKTLTG